MFKKWMLSILIMFVSLTGLMPFHADAKDFAAKTGVDPNHDWTITFNTEMKADTVNPQFVYVTKEDKKAADIKVTLNEDKRSLTVHAPSAGYEPGQTYILVIKNGMIATNNNLTQSDTKLTFTIADNPSVKEVFQIVNEEREKAGLNPLKMNEDLNHIAYLKSKDFVDNNYFDHQSPVYGSPFEMMEQFGIDYRTAGENIAAGQTSAENVMKAWMNSPGHRANILNKNYTEIGIGLYFDPNSTYHYYWTQEFTGGS